VESLVRHPLVLLGLVTLAPFALGWLLGLGAAAAARPWRDRAGRASLALAARLGALALLPPLAALALVRVRVGVWDAAWAGLCAALGALAATADLRARRRQIALAAAATALALLLAEAAARVALPPPPGVPSLDHAEIRLPAIDPDRPRAGDGNFAYGPFFVFGPLLMLDSCGYLHPARYPQFLGERLRRSAVAPPAEAVLHLGDSMTLGQLVSPAEAYPARLEAATPGVLHVNAGVASTSVDYHYALMEHWLPALAARGVRVRLVVLSLYYNDLLEIDQTLACCDDGPLVAYGPGGARDRCPQARWPAGYGSSPSFFLSASPTPYALRFATPVSHLARHVQGAWTHWIDDHVRRGPGRDGDGQRSFVAVLAAVRRSLAARGVPLVVVLQPPRYALQAARPGDTWAHQVHQRMREGAAEAGVRALDAYPHFAALARRDGLRRWFVGDGDIHLTPAGHQALADWLLPQIAPLLPSARPP
jgi:hypothetical protein